MSATTEIVAELRRALDERDEAQARVLDAALIHADLVRERDEARANYQWMVDRACDEKLEGYRELAAKCAQLEEERDEARADAERYLADLRRCAAAPYEHAKERAEAYRRGAEAMREACIGYAHKIGFHGLTVDLRALPIPEEP